MRRARIARSLPVALSLALAWPTVAAAQVAPLGFGPVDALVWGGRIEAAETALYDRVAVAPKAAAPRAALGRWLVARGAVRPGAVLLEEARFFGGDEAAVARDLAPAYERLGDWRALVGLPSSPLTAGERRRAEALLRSPTQANLGDSTTVALVATGGTALGAVVLRVGDAQVTARIDPAVRGVVLDTAWRARGGVESYAESTGRPVVGLAARAAIGGLVWTRLPVRFAPTGGALDARIGLDVLAAHRPTFDTRRGVLVLRRPADRREARAEGVAWPVLQTPAGWAIVPPRDSLRPLAGQAARAAIAGRTWTLEASRGVITVVYENELYSR